MRVEGSGLAKAGADGRGDRVRQRYGRRVSYGGQVGEEGGGFAEVGTVEGAGFGGEDQGVGVGGYGDGGDFEEFLGEEDAGGGADDWSGGVVD